MPLSWPRAIVGLATAVGGGITAYTGAVTLSASTSAPLLEWTGIVVVILGLVAIFVP